MRAFALKRVECIVVGTRCAALGGGGGGRRPGMDNTEEWDL